MRAEMKVMEFFKSAKGKQHVSPELAATFEGHDGREGLERVHGELS